MSGATQEGRRHMHCFSSWALHFIVGTALHHVQCISSCHCISITSGYDEENWSKQGTDKRERRQSMELRRPTKFVPNTTTEDFMNRVHLISEDYSLLPYWGFPIFMTSSHILGQNKTECISKWIIVQTTSNYNAIKFLKIISRKNISKFEKSFQHISDGNN